MRKRTIKHTLSFMILGAMLIIFGVFSLKAEASWVDRDASGIYSGDVEGTIESMDENAVEDSSTDEGTNWFLRLLNQGICYIITLLGRLLYSLLDTIGASLDRLIYGYLVSDTPLFTFDLSAGNIWGIVSAAIYKILRNVTILGCIVIFMGKIAGSAWKRGDFAKSALKDAAGGLALGILLLLLMPNFLDLALYIRDCILYLIGTDGAKSLFGSGRTTSIIGVLAAAANDSIMSAIMFDAAVLLNLYFLLVYIGVALAMCVNFILFPFVVIKMHFDKQVLMNWVWEEVSCLLVPVLDAVLIMIPSYMGIYSGRIGIGDAVAVAVMQVLTCFAVIPARNAMKSILGLRTSVLEGAGLMASSFLGMAAFRGLGNTIAGHKETKKNAEADLERADMEDDIAQMEKDENGIYESGQGGQGDLVSAGDIQGKLYHDAGYADAVVPDKDNMAADAYDDKSPLGLKQTYADGVSRHLESYGDDWTEDAEEYGSLEDLVQNAEKLNAVEEQMKTAAAKKNALQDEYDKTQSDIRLSDEDRAQKLNSLGEQMEAADDALAELTSQRDALMTVDDKIRAANKKRDGLEQQYQDIENNVQMAQPEKDRALNTLSGQIDEVDQELENLKKQKMHVRMQQEQAQLAKEPELLRREQQDLAQKNETLMQEREQLVRQRGQLAAKQGEQSVGSGRYKQLGTQIEEIDRNITAAEQALGENTAHINDIQSALTKQENGLRDRQAYNLHERVKAQASYDAAKSALSDLESAASQKGLPRSDKQRLDERIAEQKGYMSQAQKRLSGLALEDRRIAAKLNEISPGLNTYSVEELQTAKKAQQVRKAAIQKEIAAVEEKMAGNPNDLKDYRQQIARLRSEAADASYQTARIDQMMDGIPGRPLRNASKRAQSVISDEYEQKRRAVMERYANIDNFEGPDFSGISHERRAELYRERALQSTRIFRHRVIGGVAGGAAGAMMGIWLGGSGVVMGAMAGGTMGAEAGELRANVLNRRHEMASGKIAPTDYKNIPLDIKISSDIRDNTHSGQQRTVDRVRASLMEALETDQFQQAYTQTLVENDIMEREVQVLFKKYGITKDNYAANRTRLLKEFIPAVTSGVENAKMRVIEQCAGQEYANMSKAAKERLARSVNNPNMDMIQQLCAEVYLREDWQPDYEDYIV